MTEDKKEYKTKYKVGDKVILINNYVATIEDIDSDDFNTTSSLLEGRGLYNLNYFVRYENEVAIYISLRDIKDIKLDLLTEEEKNYLTNIIKPLKKDSNVSDFYITKHKTLPYSSEYIEICLYSPNGDFITSINFPSFKEGKYYKGLDLYKNYNIKELGI